MYQSESEQKLSSSFNIICVARLEKIKGHKYLIDALAQLKIQNIDFRCFLVGDGELRHQIQAQINRLNLITTVVILGFKTHQQVVELLSQVDIFVLPSLSEGIPVAAMEAMAAGLPVIATSVSGVPELVVDGVTGLLVPSQNSDELAKAFIKLHNSQELRHKLGKAGQSKVNNEFSIQKSTSLLYDIFQNE
jgi:colanic acid/amylovoran biosynthesis glycosyltransferase